MNNPLQTENKYARLMGQIICNGVVSVSFLLAKEKGILSTLMASECPLTSHQIAQQRNIKERVTRELLGCLSASGLVHVTDSVEQPAYFLEADAKRAMVEGVQFGYAEMNYIKILMTRYEAVKESMDIDKPGYVIYEQSFFELMDEHRQKLSPDTIKSIFKNTPGLKQQLEKGIDVIEFGCGSACGLSTLAAMFPNSHFTATDLEESYMEPLRTRYKHLSNMSFGTIDLCNVPEKVKNKYDWLCINDVIHDLPRPIESMKAIKRMMKENSVLTMVEPAMSGSHKADQGNEFAAFIYTMSTFCCIPESYQNGDSQAHGLSMGKNVMINDATQAGFEVNVFDLHFGKALYVLKEKRNGIVEIKNTG